LGKIPTALSSTAFLAWRHHSFLVLEHLVEKVLEWDVFNMTGTLQLGTIVEFNSGNEVVDSDIAAASMEHIASNG
jgi:hypothetical protein